MNKNELIDYVAGKSDLSKTQITQVIDLTFGAIEEELKKGGDVRYTGFGTFKVSSSAARTGRNPRTGETIKIAASKRVKFAAGKELKEAVNQ